MEKLNSRTLAKTLAMLASVLWLIATVWHGLLGQPSLMPYMYSWFSFSNPIHAVALLGVWMAVFYFVGYLIAFFYNRNVKNSKRKK